MRRSGWKVALLAVPLLVAAACSSTSTTTSSASTSAAPSSGAAGTAPSGSEAASPGKVGHVFVINFENKSYDETWGSSSKATYLNGTLVPKGKLLTEYHGTAHASLGNYIAQISGQAPTPQMQADCFTYSDFEMTGTAALDQAVGSGCVFPAEVQTVADQLDAKGLTWAGYMEDMGNDPDAPATCRHPQIGAKDRTVVARDGDQYTTRHNPFMYFHSIIDSPACDERVVPLDRLEAALSSVSSTPNLSYITPSLCNDGHDEPCVDGEPGGLVSADGFLRTWVPKIMGSPAFQQDGALIITFDEAEISGPDGDASACCDEQPGPNSAMPGINGPGGGKVGALVLSRFVEPGTTTATPFNHYGLLCTIEEELGLAKLGMAGQPGLVCFGDEVFDNRSAR